MSGRTGKTIEMQEFINFVFRLKTQFPLMNFFLRNN